MVHARTSTSVQINGPALRTIRELTGVSCSALARAVGADVSFLARVERGEKKGVRRETFERIVWELRLPDPRAILVNPYGANVRRGTASGIASDFSSGITSGIMSDASTSTAA